MNPRISIITISYNSEKYLEEAIQSVINQKYPFKEYIIVDGGSTDETLRIVEKYKNNIDLIISERDRGISDAFNKGIRAATGDVVCIVNSDDIMAENALERFAQQYEEEIDVFRGQQIIRNFDTGREHILRPTMEYKRIPINFQVCHMATYIRRDSFERFGYYDTTFKISMDRDLLFCFHRQGAREKRLEGIFGIFRLGGVSQNADKCKIEEGKVLMQKNGASVLETWIYCAYIWCRVIGRRLLKRY